MAKVKVWVTDLGNPCDMAKRNWVIAVSNCEGEVVNYKGVSYESVPAPNGYAEIELPPGKYVVRGTAHSWWYQGQLFGNWSTDHGVVVVCCDCDACLILYAPSVQSCWIPLFDVVFKVMATEKKLNKEFIAAVETINKQIAQLPIPKYEEGERKILRKMFEATKNVKETPKKK